jgi:hypothetical protein
MAKPPLLPRLTIHLLTAFAVVTILVIVFFPTLSYTKSVYRAGDDGQLTITDAFQNDAAAPSILLEVKQPQQYPDDYKQADRGYSQKAIDAPTKTSTLNIVVSSTLRLTWRFFLLCWQFLSLLFRALQYLAGYILDKVIFLLQPFIILGTGFFTLTIVWPSQIVSYLTSTLYPLYIFLACASIVGLTIGVVANFTTSHLNNLLFPPRPLRKPVTPRPVTADSADSLLSSGTATPASHLRAPPPSKYPSGANLDDIHILDTNALFTSFALPAPPRTPSVLYSAPTPAGSVAGVLGETIFEEEDDSDDKNLGMESWTVGAGRPLSRSGSAHGRRSGGVKTAATGTWHGTVKREDVAAQGMDWGEDGMRRRNVAVT